MRHQALPVLAAASLSTILVLLRHELRELAQLARTYATFYPYLAHHQDVLYRYPSTESASRGSIQDEFVPPIFHRIQLPQEQDNSTSSYEDALESCRSLHTNWTHLQWTEEGASAFMKDYYPDLLPLYTQDIRSLDSTKMLKYGLLEVYGGVYLDLDVTCLQSLDGLRTLPFLTLGAYPAGVDEAFVLSRRNHPLLRQLLRRAEKRAERWRLPLVADLLNAGSVYFKNDWMSYMRCLGRSGEQSAFVGDRAYILTDTNGKIETHVLHGGGSTPLFRDRDASVSYGWDTTGMFMVSRHWVYFVIMMGIGAVATAMLLWRISKRRRHSWTSREKKIGGRLSPAVPNLDDKC
jgi:inositol phosphorylceramide mannosyltransferase catalytic subunit